MDVVVSILKETWFVLAAMSPYLLIGFLIAGFLSIFISPDIIERHLGGNGILPVLKAAAFGVPLPLCSCGVIPVAAGLRRHGASRGATTAFMLSTPQTGVDSIMVTYSLLGPVFAIFRPVMALVSGVIGGGVVDLSVKEEAGEGVSAIHCTDECCNPSAGSGGRIKRALRYGFSRLPRDIGKALLVGLVIAGLISALMPKDFFAAHNLGRGPLQILVMMLLGIPVYVCATASVPVAAAFVFAGVSPGAALAFLVTGPGTNAATVATVWKTMGRRTAILYLATVAVTAFGAGFLLDAVFPNLTIPAAQGFAHVHGTSWEFWLDNVCAVALLIILGIAVFRPTLGRLGGPVEAGEAAPAAMVVTLTIEGMDCDHCVESVTRELKEVNGVQSVEVDLHEGSAVVGGSDSLDTNALLHAVEHAGYKAKLGKP